MNEMIACIRDVMKPINIIILSIIVGFIARFFFHLKYLDFKKIIVRHYDSYKKENGRYNVIAIFFHSFIPFLLAVSLIFIKKIDSNTVNIITVIVSILTSMLLTLLTLIIDMSQRVKDNGDLNATDVNLRLALLKETYYSIMFEVLVSICILIMSFICIFSDVHTYVESFIIYWLTFILLTTLFIVLKKIFNIIENGLGF